jgi:hypothetical protein
MGGVYLCAEPSCSDGVKNGIETSTDCGGGCPKKCPPLAGCAVNADCIGGACDAGSKTCSPTCADGFQNGSETDLDCGGSCPAKCGVGLHCNDDIDCVSQNCYRGHCFP